MDAEREQKEEALKDKVPEVEQFDEATEAMLTDTLSKVGNLDSQAALHSVIKNGGELTHELTARIATSLGMDTEATKEHVGHIIEQFRKQAHAAVGENIADAVWEWARNNNRSGDLEAAMYDHANKGTTTGYKALVRGYFESLADTPEGRNIILNATDAKSQGVFRDRNGKLYVTHPKVGRVEWRVAVREGVQGVCASLTVELSI